MYYEQLTVDQITETVFTMNTLSNLKKLNDMGYNVEKSIKDFSYADLLNGDIVLLIYLDIIFGVSNYEPYKELLEDLNLQSNYDDCQVEELNLYNIEDKKVNRYYEILKELGFKDVYINEYLNKLINKFHSDYSNYCSFLEFVESKNTGLWLACYAIDLYFLFNEYGNIIDYLLNIKDYIYNFVNDYDNYREVKIRRYVGKKKIKVGEKSYYNFKYFYYRNTKTKENGKTIYTITIPIYKDYICCKNRKKKVRAYKNKKYKKVGIKNERRNNIKNKS